MMGKSDLYKNNSEEQFKSLVDNIPGIIYRCACDSDWTMYFISDNVKKITGYPASDFINNKVRAFGDIIHPDDAQIIENKVNHAVQNKEPFVLEYRIFDSDGNEIWVYEKGQGVFDDNGELRWLDGAIFDITQQKELELLKQDIERITRHDLKGPLNAIIMIPHILKQTSNLDEEMINGLNKIEESGKQMLNMLNMSLNLRKIELGTYEFNPGKINIIEVAKIVVEDLSNLAKLKGIEVITSLNGNPLKENDSMIIRAEELLCYSIISNLVKNALEASPYNEVVSISLTDDDKKRVCIHNYGVIPETIRNSFFDKYTTYGKGKNGTGLGTYSAKLMTELQNGRIFFNSTQETGTKLAVEFP